MVEGYYFKNQAGIGTIKWLENPENTNIAKAEEIKEIKELLDSGAINEDDYEKMKREIIG